MTEFYRGQCHCGKLSYEVRQLPETVTHCNCSICSRYQAVWGYYRRDEVRLADTDNAARTYRWNDKVIDFVHCRVCGCITHYEDVDKSPEGRVAVNFRMCDDPAWRHIRIRHFDGANIFQEIQEDKDGKDGKDDKEVQEILETQSGAEQQFM